MCFVDVDKRTMVYRWVYCFTTSLCRGLALAHAMQTKICKIHGELSPDLIKSGVYKGKPYRKCKQCEYERGVIYHKKQREDIEKLEAKRLKDKAYWEANKTKIKERRLTPESQARRKASYPIYNERYRTKYKEKQAEYRDNLHDSYIKKLIQNGDKNIKIDSIPQSIIEFKRSLIKLKKGIKTENINQVKGKINEN
jgi:hypothetical protein